MSVGEQDEDDDSGEQPEYHDVQQLWMLAYECIRPGTNDARALVASGDINATSDVSMAACHLVLHLYR